MASPQYPAAAAAPSDTSSGTGRPGNGWKRIQDDLPPPPDLAEADPFDDVEPEAKPLLGPDGEAYCGTCRGTRWLRLERDLGDRDFAKLRRCPDCADLQRAHRLTRLATAAGLSEEQRLKTFASFKPSRGSHLAVKAAAHFAQRPDGWLVIHGEPGSGKTHLSLAVANARIAQELPVAWWYGADLAFEAQRRIGHGTQFEFLSELRSAPLLIIDDLGTARGTEYRIGDVLEPLFDARYRHRLPTLVTLIGSPAEVKEHLSESIGRRFEDRSVCQVIHNMAPQWGLGEA